MAEFESIHRDRATGDPPSSYIYEIRRNGVRIAELRHNHRGEEFFIRVGSMGKWEPFDDVLEGGGSEPLRMTTAGTAILKRRLPQK